MEQMPSLERGSSTNREMLRFRKGIVPIFESQLPLSRLILPFVSILHITECVLHNGSSGVLKHGDILFGDLNSLSIMSEIMTKNIPIHISSYMRAQLTPSTFTHLPCLLFVGLAEASLHDDTGDEVRVGVGSGPTVLEVAITLGTDLAGDTDGCTTIGDTIGELVNGAGLVPTSQPLFVVLAVDSDVLLRHVLAGIPGCGTDSRDIPCGDPLAS